MKFNNKIIWITGASSGIGKALAIEASELGAKVIISSRNVNKLEEVRRVCENADNVKILKLDLDDYRNFDTIVDKAIQLFDGLDVLINNGGISQRSLAVNTDISVDEKIFKTNYFGTIALTKAILPFFIQKKKGHIVVITSVVAKVGTPLRTSYAASKHALHGFFDSLRAEIYNDNIDVTLICPGYVKTNVSLNALVGDGSRQNTMDKATSNGLLPSKVAKRMFKAISKKKQEVVVGGILEVLAVWIKRFFPRVIARMIRKIDVT